LLALVVAVCAPLSLEANAKQRDKTMEELIRKELTYFGVDDDEDEIL